MRRTRAAMRARSGSSEIELVAEALRDLATLPWTCGFPFAFASRLRCEPSTKEAAKDAIGGPDDSHGSWRKANRRIETARSHTVK
jgi:hypothetical protein